MTVSEKRDVDSTPLRPRPQRNWLHGLKCGAVATVPALFLTIMSGGLVGHGDYVLARLLYPVPIFMVAVADEYGNELLKPFFFYTILIQFPIYWMLLSVRTRLTLSILTVLLVIHVLGIIACFHPDLSFIFY